MKVLRTAMYEVTLSALQGSETKTRELQLQGDTKENNFLPTEGRKYILPDTSIIFYARQILKNDLVATPGSLLRERYSSSASEKYSSISSLSSSSCWWFLACWRYFEIGRPNRSASRSVSRLPFTGPLLGFIKESWLAVAATLCCLSILLFSCILR